MDGGYGDQLVIFFVPRMQPQQIDETWILSFPS